MKPPLPIALAVLGVAPVLSLHAADAKKKVLIVETTTGYRHASIPTGEAVIKKLADESGAFEVAGIVRQPEVKVPPKSPGTEADEKARAAQAQFDAEMKASLEVLSPANLDARGIDGVIFDSTTGELPLPDKQGFIDWVKAGHAFIGMHSATDTLHEFKPYIEMIGGEFDGHPWHQAVTVKVEDPSSPVAGSYHDKFEVSDEIYQFKNYNRGDLRVVLGLDASNEERPKGGTPPNTFFERGKRPDKDYAVSWVRDFGQGRVFYTSLGHENAVWNDPKVQEHMLGGIKWALGLTPKSKPR